MSGRKISGINNKYISDFLGSKAGILIRAGKVTTDAEMDNTAALLRPAVKFLCIIRDIYGAGLWELSLCMNVFINIVRCDFCSVCADPFAAAD